MHQNRISRYYGVIHVERDTNKEIMQVIPSYVDYECKYNSLSMTFHKLRVDMTITDISLKRFAVSDIKHFILALPYMGPSGYHTNNQSMYM